MPDCTQCGEPLSNEDIRLDHHDCDASAMCDCGEVLSDDDLRSDARECSNCRNPWERFDNRDEDRLS